MLLCIRGAVSRVGESESWQKWNEVLAFGFINDALLLVCPLTQETESNSKEELPFFGDDPLDA